MNESNKMERHTNITVSEILARTNINPNSLELCRIGRIVSSRFKSISTGTKVENEGRLKYRVITYPFNLRSDIIKIAEKYALKNGFELTFKKRDRKNLVKR